MASRSRRPATSLPTTWLELSVSTDREVAEVLAGIFANWGQGVAIHEPVVSSRDGEEVWIDPTHPVRVVTHIPADADAERRRAKLEQAVWHLSQIRPIGPLEARPVSDDEWADAWKAYFHVHRVGRRTVIVPSWRRFRPAPNDVVVRLDPGMAFGTGLHPTTRLCVAALERLVRGGERVLDLGCGSGVLSITAARLGAAHVCAVDVEPLAVEITARNARRNRVARIIGVHEGTLDAAVADGLYHLAVANISFSALHPLAGPMREVIKPHGVVVLSGLLEEKAGELLDAWQAEGWEHIANESDEDWCAIEFRRRP